MLSKEEILNSPPGTVFYNALRVIRIKLTDDRDYIYRNSAGSISRPTNEFNLSKQSVGDFYLVLNKEVEEGLDLIQKKYPDVFINRINAIKVTKHTLTMNLQGRNHHG